MYKYIITASILALSMCLGAQSISPFVISNGGDYFHQENQDLHFTFGELSVSYLQTRDGIISEGFQQGIIDINTSLEILKLFYNISIYPNPTSDYITINVTDHQGIMTAYISDVTGKILHRTRFSQHTELSLNHQPAGTYFVTLVDNQQRQGTISLIKI